MRSVCTFAITLRYIKIALDMVQPLQLLTVLTPFPEPSDRLVPVHWRMLPPARRGPIPALPELPSLSDERPGGAMGMGGWRRMGERRTKGLCRTAWDGMDACTRCGEAIPVVWARNTDDPSGHHTHTYIHTRTHARTHHAHTHTLAHLTQQTDHPADHGSPEPRRTRRTRPRRQTVLHLEGQTVQ